MSSQPASSDTGLDCTYSSWRFVGLVFGRAHVEWLIKIKVHVDLPLQETNKYYATELHNSVLWELCQGEQEKEDAQN
jgi:hypothetical protein